jgi:diaminopimelate decarboxylase
MASKYDLSITMAHFHVGSGFLDANLFINAAKNVFDAIRTLDLPDLTHVNLGGGFGTPYHPDDKHIDLKHIMTRVEKMHSEFDRDKVINTTLVIEPGRYLVNESGILLVNLNTISRNNHRVFYRTDSGFNHLIRPMMYGSYHHFVNASRLDGPKEKVILSGNICEGGDVFNTSPREITKGENDDTIAIFDVGAYGVSMGMSLYNMRGLPAEIMIKPDGTIKQFATAQKLTDIISRYII